MRLHHLEVTGFGPFADPARIDFDALSDAGLFLLSGPTGAGKSSVLDAVCFALYGDVPGDRATAKRLRSDHAGDDVVPRVVLEATLSGRRFRIDRSPAWRRPKKRGTGTTTEQARVVISERRRDPDGTDAWHPLSTRLDETGHLVTRLVGMTLPQFCQVALLPQGRFQAFLRARSEERHALLQQVFRTERFDQVERWLRERRVELRRASDDHRATLADLASRVSEVSGDPAPDDWPDIPDLLLDWAHALARTTAGRAASEAEVVEATAASERVAADAAAAGTELAGRRAEHAAAERDLAGLLQAADEHQRDVASIEAAERALAVRPVQEVALTARAAEDGAARGLATLRRDLARVVDTSEGVEPDDQQVAELQRAAVGALTELARVRPLRDEADALAADLARLERERATAATRSEGLAARAAELPALLDDLAPGSPAPPTPSRSCPRSSTSSRPSTSGSGPRWASRSSPSTSRPPSRSSGRRRPPGSWRARRSSRSASSASTGWPPRSRPGSPWAAAARCGSAEHPSPRHPLPAHPTRRPSAPPAAGSTTSRSRSRPTRRRCGDSRPGAPLPPSRPAAPGTSSPRIATTGAPGSPTPARWPRRHPSSSAGWRPARRPGRDVRRARPARRRGRPARHRGRGDGRAPRRPA
ncbi:AAA family ATPase [Nocardioides okcheonensis]|uniref:AAA family ATPase n=1 Tax=Nocardioides okcheonensis TaxID=2894081 RepID=UPI001E45C796|nr:AAA family ATPase [Nocardioides okcheonensis]UFN45074.1 AAA family ATPase [Nocardioides okcheonensis]